MSVIVIYVTGVLVYYTSLQMDGKFTPVWEAATPVTRTGVMLPLLGGRIRFISLLGVTFPYEV